jgi:hypothetical protein
MNTNNFVVKTKALRIKAPLLAAVLAVAGQFCSVGVSANQIVVTSSPNAVIPDGDQLGLVEMIDLSTSITSISDVSLTLNISGGYNGDYYAYLRHTDSSGLGFSVLLNRVGESGAAQYGSSDNGFNVTLSDAASGNIHDANAAGAVLTGTYRPDGRNISPFSDPTTLATTIPSALLNSFNGMDANGQWELFIADVSSGSVGTLTSWGITVTENATAVPDRGSTLLLFGGCCCLLLVKRPSWRLGALKRS